MNFKIKYVGIFSLMFSVAILGNVHSASLGQSANTTQGNTSFTNSTQSNMTEQTLSSEEATQVTRENSAIGNDNQENEEKINSNDD